MRSKQTSGLYKVDPAVPNAKLEPGKISEMLLEFAAPLLQLGADGPPDIKVLGQLMMLTEMCWNLPVFETNDPAAHAHFKQDFDRAVRAVPGPIANILKQLVADRKSLFHAVPFLVHVQLNHDGDGDVRLIAEARMPRALATVTSQG